MGVHSHFHIQPNYSVEVVLCCRWGCDKISGCSLLFDNGRHPDSVRSPVVLRHSETFGNNLHNILVF